MLNTCSKNACVTHGCAMWCSGNCNGGFAACSFCAGATRCACNNNCESACVGGCGNGCSTCCFGLNSSGCSGFN